MSIDPTTFDTDTLTWDSTLHTFDEEYTGLNGRFFVFQIRTGTNPDVYSGITHERNFTFTDSRNKIDASSKSSNRAADFIPGQYSGSFAVDGLLIPVDSIMNMIEADLRGSGIGKARRFQNNVAIEEFDFVYEELTRTGVNEEAATYSLSGAICGFPVAL